MNPERPSSCARRRYVRPRTDRTRNKCFTDTCCQSVPFATCLPRHWLMHALVQCQLSRSSSSSPPCSPPFGRTIPTRTRKQYAPSRSIQPTRRKCFAGACPRTNFSLSSSWSETGPIGWVRPAVRGSAAMFLSSPGIMTEATNSTRIDWGHVSTCPSPSWSACHAAIRAPDCSRN